MKPVLLLLAGTREAREFAEGFHDTRFELVASLAGVTREPVEYPCKTRFGGFGGAGPMAAWLCEHRVAAVIDATHPFAEQISRNAAIAADKAGAKRLLLRRPAWEPEEGWRAFDTLAEATAALPAGARAFATTGRNDFNAFGARTDVSFVLRSIEPAEGLPLHIETVTGRPPFTLEDECAFMHAAQITHLITKNSGGARPAKLAAAARLGIPIYAVRMPPAPVGEAALTVELRLSKKLWLGPRGSKPARSRDKQSPARAVRVHRRYCADQRSTGF